MQSNCDFKNKYFNTQELCQEADVWLREEAQWLVDKD